MARIYLKWWNGKKPTTKITPPGQGPHSDSKEKSKASQISKIKRIQHHQTNSTINAKRISLDRKHEKERQTKQIPNNKVNGNMIIYISIFTLHVNELNAPTKRQIGWIDTKIRLLYMLSTRDPPQTYRNRLKVRDW